VPLVRGWVVLAVLAPVAAACASTPRRTPEAAKPIEAPVEVPEALVLARPIPRSTSSRVEGHLGKKICSGTPGPKDRPKRAVCCYPAKEVVLRPLRAAFPALRACYDAREKRDAEGRVAFTFRIEKDGSVAHACAGENSTMDDEGAARCMLEVLRDLRYPSSSDAEIDLCGLMTITYPVGFEP
jgi:hypothetical protein